MAKRRLSIAVGGVAVLGLSLVAWQRWGAPSCDVDASAVRPLPPGRELLDERAQKDSDSNFHERILVFPGTESDVALVGEHYSAQGWTIRHNTGEFYDNYFGTRGDYRMLIDDDNGFEGHIFVNVSRCEHAPGWPHGDGGGP
jgi:hypothetical protein